MFFRFLFLNTGLNRLHCADLSDMRRALVDEDQDGPDGGSPHAAARSTPRIAAF